VFHREGTVDGSLTITAQVAFLLCVPRKYRMCDFSNGVLGYWRRRTKASSGIRCIFTRSRKYPTDLTARVNTEGRFSHYASPLELVVGKVPWYVCGAVLKRIPTRA
jgi:hypothetical protein